MIDKIVFFTLGLAWGYFCKVVIDFFLEEENESVYR